MDIGEINLIRILTAVFLISIGVFGIWSIIYVTSNLSYFEKVNCEKVNFTATLIRSNDLIVIHNTGESKIEKVEIILPNKITIEKEISLIKGQTATIEIPVQNFEKIIVRSKDCPDKYLEIS